MASPLESEVRNAVAAGFKGLLLTGTIRRETVLSLSAEGDPITSFVDYTFEGIRDSFSAWFIASSGIQATDSRILIIAGLCPIVPTQDDKIKIGGSWFQVRRVVEIDPAGATYTLAGFAIPAP